MRHALTEDPGLPISSALRGGMGAIMEQASFVFLEDRGVIEITGPDRVTFLQGLVSNDVTKATPAHALYAAFLTPQGKYLHDFFITADAHALYLETEGARAADLAKRFSLYKLRAKVVLSEVSARLRVAACFGAEVLAKLDLPKSAGAARALGGGVVYVDPRLAEMGARTLLPRAEEDAPFRAAGLVPARIEAYDRTRLALGVPDGSRDLVVEKAILLEAGFDELNGVDWNKGCYIGQELTARTKYRALIKKRLLPARIEGPLPPPGTKVMAGSEEAGEVRSGGEGMVLALLRLDLLD